MIIGITGSFGSGKTTVSRMFKRMGAYVIDADKAYHSLIMPGQSCYKKIVGHFGEDILNSSGKIDREKMAGIVFKQKTKRRLLNKISHPEIMKKIKDIIKSRKEKVIIIEAPLLLESGFYKEVDRVVLVANKKEEQVKRMRENKGLSARRVSERIRMQMPFREKIAFADFIIDNSGSKANTLSQVKTIWKQISEAITYGARSVT